MKDYNLELQNSKIGIASRQDINALPTPLKQVDKDLIDEYNAQFPNGYVKEGKTYLYDIKNPPELDDIGDLAPEYNNFENEINEIMYNLNIVENDLLGITNNQKLVKKNMNFENMVASMKDLEYLKADEKLAKSRINELKAELDRINEFKRMDTDNKLENKAKIDLIKKNNADKIRQYQEELLVMNSGNMSLKKQPNETEEQYLERLRQNAEIEVTDTKIQNAKQLTMRKFREKMKEIIRNEVLIEQVSNSVDADNTNDVTNRLSILKKWEDFKKKFLEIYGFDNKFINYSDILEFIHLYLLNADTRVLLEQKNKNINIPKIPDIPKIPPLLPSQFKRHNLIVEDAGFGGKVLISTDTGNSVYLGISRDINGNLITMYSLSGEEGTYKSIPTSSPNKVKQTITEITDALGISYSEFTERFGASTTTIAKNLSKQQTELKPYKQIITERKKTSQNIYGYGINEIDLPKSCKFGKIYINAHKLYYNNILSPTLPNGNHILGFKNIKVSDKFVDILVNMIKGNSPSHVDLNLLPNTEKLVYDKLIHIAGLHRKYPNNSDKTIDTYKKRLNLLEGQINMGNNNPEIKNEIYEIIHTLHNFGMITNSQKKQYLTQL